MLCATGACVLAATLAPDPAASTPVAAGVVSPTAAVAVEARRAEVDEQIESLRGALERATEDTRALLEKQLYELERVDSLLVSRRAALGRADEIEEQRARAEEELQNFRAAGPAGDPPGILRVDAAAAAAAAAEERQRDLTSVVAAESVLKEAQEQLEGRERDRRRAKEAVESATDRAERANLEQAHRLAQLRSRNATELVDLRQIELRNEKARRDVEAIILQRLRERAALLESGAQLSRDELGRIFEGLDKEAFDLERLQKAAENAAGVAGDRWSSAQRRLDRETDPTATLIAEVEAHRLEQLTQQRAVSLFEQREQHLGVQREVWQRRFRAVHSNVSRRELLDWKADAESWLEEAQRRRHLHEARIAELQAQSARRNVVPPNSREARWQKAQREHLDERVEHYRASLVSLTRTERLQKRIVRLVDSRVATVSLSERLRMSWDYVVAIWTFEVISIDDRPITVGKVVAGIALITLGLTFAGFLSRQLGRHVLPRLGFDVSASAALETVAYYILLIVVTLSALRVLNVPLTIFTLLGGALAIGLGFGSQTLVSNFISGLILFAERPIKVGDLIDVDGLYGIVEQIGARSTRIRSGENVHIIIPNSAFLEKNVVNFTLSDDNVRTHVAVGVAYGSPTREVARMLKQAVEEHGKILKKPAPTVLFECFGDNALQFEVHFWVHMRRLMDRRTIQSDIRYRIDGLFREAGISIAFPQRDVHIDGLRPIEVRMIPPPESGPDGDEAA